MECGQRVMLLKSNSIQKKDKTYNESDSLKARLTSHSSGRLDSKAFMLEWCGEEIGVRSFFLYESPLVSAFTLPCHVLLQDLTLPPPDVDLPVASFSICVFTLRARSSSRSMSASAERILATSIFCSVVGPSNAPAHCEPPGRKFRL